MLNIGESVSYATVWQPVVEERRVICNLSSSKKLKVPKEDGKEYENSNWKNAVFIGKAFEKARKSLKERDNIKITSGTVDNLPYTAADGTVKYFNHVVIFDFEIMIPKDRDESDMHVPSYQAGTQFAPEEEDMDDVPY